ncbi:conserved hypothetical protein [Vibrio crassostreae]|nr:conserved hypothetical protein [Vibrio crassostreae]CAK1816659.1 conserved hypothetical protein [Vibrio crassostreae]CAK2428044.1 conserved hypothetical protein [Vibrio crassostreae]CAK2702853.1 conserved hypothetical protein [Vibrio crassostreae]CAK2756178.1 conserved hypothetical protein [Vibrio crassostreae]
MSHIDPRAKKNSDGVLSLIDLLKSIAIEPQAYVNNTELIQSLKSQGRTAALHYEFTLNNEKKSTRRMSLNTLKTYADKLLEDGFEGLERLRIGAYDAISNYKSQEDKPNRRTKTGLLKTVNSLESQLEIQRKVNFILLQAVSSTMYSIKLVRDGDNPALRRKHSEDALDRIRAILSLNPTPFEKPIDNVISFEEFRGSNEQD